MGGFWALPLLPHPASCGCFAVRNQSGIMQILACIVSSVSMGDLLFIIYFQACCALFCLPWAPLKGHFPVKFYGVLETVPAFQNRTKDMVCNVVLLEVRFVNGTRVKLTFWSSSSTICCFLPSAWHSRWQGLCSPFVSHLVRVEGALFLTVSAAQPNQ